ncbi:tRNA-uridine aminocarboxypropyltransferase [Acidobacteriota bacterium]
MSTFLEQREKRKTEAKISLDSTRKYCTRCMRPEMLCLCSTVQPFDTLSHFLILQHPKEAKRVRNGTGRLTHLHLTNSRMFSGLDYSSDSQLNGIISDPVYFPMVLYPGPRSTETGDLSFTDILKGGKRALFILLDGTWRTAKKMMILSQNLHSLLQISITPSQYSKFFIKTQPRENCVSTIETVYYLLEELKKQRIENLQNEHERLMDTLDRIVEFQIQCTESASKPGYRKDPTSKKREPRIRPDSRNPYF